MDANATVSLTAWQLGVAFLGTSGATALLQHFLQRPDKQWARYRQELRDLWDAIDRLEKKVQRYRHGYYDLVNRYIAGQRRVVELATELCNGCDKRNALVQALNQWRSEDLREPFAVDEVEDEEDAPERGKGRRDD